MAFEIGEFPIYFGLEGPGASGILAKALEQARVVCKPVEARLLTPRGDLGVLQLRNQAGADVEARIALAEDNAAGTSMTLKMRKGETRGIEFPLKRTPATVKMTVDCGEGYDSVSGSWPVAFERCAKVKFTGKVDGDLSKWAGRPCIEMRERAQVMPPDPGIAWKGPEQFSAKVYTGWDERYFYLAAEVRDEIHSNRFPEAIWKGDCVQFAFDPLANAAALDSKPGYGKDDIEMGVALTAKGVVVTQWAGGGEAERGIECAIKRDEAAKKTFYELRIPFRALGLSPTAGMAFGFNFVIFNDDAGAGANYWYQLTPGITGGKNPELFKKFVLEE